MKNQKKEDVLSGESGRNCSLNWLIYPKRIGADDERKQQNIHLWNRTWCGKAI